jgi:hypothetical protein
MVMLDTFSVLVIGLHTLNLVEMSLVATLCQRHQTPMNATSGAIRQGDVELDRGISRDA